MAWISFDHLYLSIKSRGRESLQPLSVGRDEIEQEGAEQPPSHVAKPERAKTFLNFAVGDDGPPLDITTFHGSTHLWTLVALLVWCWTDWQSTPPGRAQESNLFTQCCSFHRQSQPSIDVRTHFIGDNDGLLVCRSSSTPLAGKPGSQQCSTSSPRWRSAACD